MMKAMYKKITKLYFWKIRINFYSQQEIYLKSDTFFYFFQKIRLKLILNKIKKDFMPLINSSYCISLPPPSNLVNCFCFHLIAHDFKLLTFNKTISSQCILLNSLPYGVFLLNLHIQLFPHNFN